MLRPITLTIRLFANMVAGHFLLLGVLPGLARPDHRLSPTSAASSPSALGVALIGFEIFVATLQAFIFTMLTASYIGGAWRPEH